MTDRPWKGRDQGHVIDFIILHPLIFFGMAEDTIVKFCARIGPRSACLVMTNCPLDGCGQGQIKTSRDLDHDELGDSLSLQD